MKTPVSQTPGLYREEKWDVHYHGSNISGSQQWGTEATITATAKKNGQKAISLY